MVIPDANTGFCALSNFSSFDFNDRTVFCIICISSNQNPCSGVQIVPTNAPSTNPTAIPTIVPSVNTSKLSSGAVAGIAIVVLCLLLLLMLLLLCVRTRRAAEVILIILFRYYIFRIHYLYNLHLLCVPLF